MKPGGGHQRRVSKPIIQSGLGRHKDLADVPLMAGGDFRSDGQEGREFMSAGSAIGRGA
jgi:hypothetical protein